jgi:hypothetical protein
MSATDLTIAERVAASICWLARQPGLPDIEVLRLSVVERHGHGCGWCDYPLPELLKMASLYGAPGLGAFSRLSAPEQRQLVTVAQSLPPLVTA